MVGFGNILALRTDQTRRLLRMRVRVSRCIISVSVVKCACCLIDILLLLANQFFLQFLAVIALFATCVWFLKLMILFVSYIKFLEPPYVLILVISEIAFIRTFQDVFCNYLRITSLLKRHLWFYLSLLQIFHYYFYFFFLFLAFLLT